MSIPKTIHYCWFGYNEKPNLAKKCIKSWKKHCPDYEIIEWNEENFDLSTSPLYVRQAYEAKKWAYVTDYVRLKVVYDNGGVYLDTDVELIKPLNQFLNHEAYFGFEDGIHVNTGLGFGAVKKASILADMIADYQDIPFLLEGGTYDITTCPVRNTHVLLRNGLIQNNTYQELHGCTIYPSDVFCPINLQTKRKKITRHTASIHYFSGSWVDPKDRKRINARKQRELLFRLSRTPNRILMKCLGTKQYEQLKYRIKALFRR